MRLVNSNNKRIVTLTMAGSITASAFVFSYNTLTDIPSKNVISSSSTDNHITQTQENTYTNMSLRIEFNKLLSAWKTKTTFMSFANQIVEDINFKKIVSYGEAMVPFIIEEIEKKPSPLVWALNYIYNQTITNKENTTIEQACKLWVNALQS